MSYVSRSMSYVCSRMYNVRVTYLSYLDTPYIRESIRNSVTVVKTTFKTANPSGIFILLCGNLAM